MKRRWLLRLALLLLVGTSSLLPPVYWRVIGWTRGEAFYQGRPTSYWRTQIQGNKWALNEAALHDPKPIWAPEITRFLWVDQVSGLDFITDESDEAMKVWRELDQDEDEMVRLLAEDRLRCKIPTDEKAK